MRPGLPAVFGSRRAGPAGRHRAGDRHSSASPEGGPGQGRCGGQPGEMVVLAAAGPREQTSAVAPVSAGEQHPNQPRRLLAAAASVATSTGLAPATLAAGA